MLKEEALGLLVISQLSRGLLNIQLLGLWHLCDSKIPTWCEFN